MEIKRYAMVKDDVVYNVCLWDGSESTWIPPQDGTLMIESDLAGIGDVYDAETGTFTRPEPPPAPSEE